MSRRNSSVLLCVLLIGVLALNGLRGPSFVGAAIPGRMVISSTHLRAEEKASESVALVKVTDENKVTTASLLGGAAGLLLGGVWVGGALFAATSYLARKEDDDVSKALKGVATSGLEILNFGSYLNNKYTVTGAIGSALSSAIKDTPVNSVTDAIDSVDKDVGIKDSLGNLATSASELAAQAVEAVVDLNNEYKITDTIMEKAKETVDQVSKATK